MGSATEDFSSFSTKRRQTKRQRSLPDASASETFKKTTHTLSVPGCSTSTSRSDDHDTMSEITIEEKDTANSLILLAQGIQNKTSNVTERKKYNNNSYVYECKTCYKTFNSFQALGGHRTSHKKIKQSTSTPVPSLDHRGNHRDLVVDLNMELFSSDKKIDVESQVSQREDDNNSKGRLHECSICGSEFPSGQALGGHMRRHKEGAPPSTTSAAATVIETGGGGGNILSFDLNLPALDDDDQQVHEDDYHMDNKFVHVLPRLTRLVDYHY